MKRKDQISSLLSNAWKFRSQGNYQEAQRLTREAQILCDEEDHIFLGRVFHVYMQIEYDHDRHATALDLARQSLAHYRASEDPQHIAHSLRHTADLLRKMARYDEAEKNYKQAVQHYRSDPGTSTLDLANALRGYAILLEAQGKSAKALFAWKETRDLYEISKISDGVLEADRHIENLSGPS